MFMKVCSSVIVAICGVLMLTACRGGARALEPMPAPTPRPHAVGRLDVRVLSFNLRYANAEDGENRWENRRELAFDVIHEYRPEVLAVQEALRSQLDDIRARFTGFDEVGVGRDDGQTRGEYSAILYRADKLKVIAQETLWLAGAENLRTPGARHPDASLPRICTWALFEDVASGERFYVYNTHLDHVSQPAREDAAVMITDAFRREQPSAGRILCGDLNAGEDNAVVKHLKGTIDLPTGSTAAPAAVASRAMVDTFRVLQPYQGKVGTYHAFRGGMDGEKIDYILAGPGWKVLQAGIITYQKDGRYPSDHFPVYARLVPER
jgi:endonuclease/exonuclease/phosphatase family metal-dependent hydrolase